MTSQAAQINGRERYKDRLYADGVLPDYEGAAAQAKSQARTCPRCRKPVHPDNWNRHQTAEHRDNPAMLHEADSWLPISLIRRDAGTQSRIGLNADLIREYAEIYAEPLESRSLPPVDVFLVGNEYVLTDGFHRVAAAEMAGFYDIPATVHLGTLREAVLFSVGANAEHGLRRSREDKCRAVDRMLNDPEWGLWADRRIARQCHVSPTFVGQRRSALSVHVDSGERVYERGGREGVMQTGKIGNVPVVPRPEIDQMQITGKLTGAAARTLGHALDMLKDEPAAQRVVHLMVEHGPVSPKLVKGLARVLSESGTSLMYPEISSGFVGGIPLSEASIGDWERAAYEARLEHIAMQEEAERTKKLAAGEPVFTPVSLTLYPGDPEKTHRALKHYMQSDGLNWYDWLVHIIQEEERK